MHPLLPRAFAAILVVGLSAAPSYAILNCHDYAYFLVSKHDFSPVGCGRQNGINVTQLTARLLELGYRIAVHGPTLDSELKPGDVLILGDAHSGFVNTSGFIDNWVQLLPDGVEKSTTGVPQNAKDLPPGAVRGQKRGGLFLNDSLHMFVTRPFTPYTDFSQIKVWRHPQGGIAKNDLWIGTWVPKTKPAKGPPVSLLVYKKDGAHHVQMNQLADLEMSITSLEPTTMATALKQKGGDYTFELQYAPEGQDTITGSWTYANENGKATFPLELVLKEQQGIKAAR